MTDNTPTWTVYNSLTVAPLSHTVYSSGKEIHLPEMEYQLLCYFLQHPGQTISRETLMLAVWGNPPGLKTRTLDIHVCQLRKKLKLGSSLQTVFRVGYRLHLPTNRNEGEHAPHENRRKK
ncbi:MAG: winged helix-turn-helix domain-containing protein [Gemmiger sp.]|uniref:winged helix-turn-helix domain-containing protein n=1 Tax=Gemmiger sp. TaxID=2049027 RepID=UPI002E76D236|nr:winged helix-turn-helix domain-containing protein [Gemmiger sp.]MEE0708927.1 winged helix-turn-helix domain-containing protein [Gemmiger sp.]